MITPKYNMLCIKIIKQKYSSLLRSVENSCLCIKSMLSKAILMVLIVLVGYPKSTLSSQDNIQKAALQKALQYYLSPKFNKSISNNQYIVIIDYTLPSDKERLYLYNTQLKKVAHQFLVAHGRGSGSGATATKVSNIPGTQASSKGAFVTTGSHYPTKHNKVIHVQGLEKGINDNAAKRTIEFHDAWYVSKDFAKKHYRVGNSTGCFAMNLKDLQLITPLIDQGTLVFVYF